MTEAQDCDGLKMAVLGFCALLLLVYLGIRCAEAAVPKKLLKLSPNKIMVVVGSL